MNITKIFLVKHFACPKAISFFERNFPETLFPAGIDLSKVKITGDFNNYISWLNGVLDNTYKYDSNGNMITKVLPNGDTYHYEYDTNGNMITEVLPDGHIYQWEYKYDSNSRLVKARDMTIEYLECTDFSAGCPA